MRRPRSGNDRPRARLHEIANRVATGRHRVPIEAAVLLTRANATHACVERRDNRTKAVVTTD
ncbi:hypothetical protein [Streptomyces sp. NPDC057460]|uniref:hypothetical protein n=1 Tax=Streptomyces sp. NPDC057460 TaxID=3346141 RepID=UPI003691F353